MNLAYQTCFSNSQQQVAWKGRHVTDRESFKQYVQGVVKPRLTDEENRVELEEVMRGLETTGMEIQTLTAILSSEVNKHPWEVGEALAECLLGDEFKVQWIWNSERDKRTPRASLPGTDLVGFLEVNGNTIFAFGEVKTSADSASPPQVLYGPSGLTNQLEELISNQEIHRSLLLWANARCKASPLRPAFQQATQQFLRNEFVLFGILMRDTSPNELDLKNRAQSLVSKTTTPTRIDFFAWYFPLPIASWPSLL